MLRASELTCDWGIPFTSHLFALTCLILWVLLPQNHANLEVFHFFLIPQDFVPRVTDFSLMCSYSNYITEDPFGALLFNYPRVGCHQTKSPRGRHIYFQLRFRRGMWTVRAAQLREACAAIRGATLHSFLAHHLQSARRSPPCAPAEGTLCARLELQLVAVHLCCRCRCLVLEELRRACFRARGHLSK